MDENSHDNIIWSTLGPSIERLNICDNAPVHKNCLKEMEYIGAFEFRSILPKLFNDDTLSAIIWYLNMNSIFHIGKIYLYKTDVYHKLRFSHKSGGHNECWIFGLLPCKDNIWRLCPLRRNSDFDYDIFEYLKKSIQK